MIKNEHVITTKYEVGILRFISAYVSFLPRATKDI